MRSRYTAYVRLDEKYLLKTWHASTRPAVLGLEHQAASKWLGLKILRIQAGGKNDETGQVEFVARFKLGGKAHRMQENSLFVKEAGRWYYLRAEPDED
jgi:SEC-C motif domain protein